MPFRTPESLSPVHSSPSFSKSTVPNTSPAAPTEGSPGSEPRIFGPRLPTAAELLQTPGVLEGQQMENIGLLAAGLAHDLNNLLTVILGSAGLARDMIPEDSPATHHLGTIESTVRRAGELCRTMLACARTDQKRREWIDANAIVRDTLSLLQTSRLAPHRVHLDLAAKPPTLPANPAQFRQIVLNLVLNAADACNPKGGKIRVSTGRVQLDRRQIESLRPAIAVPGTYARLRVSDNGCGMDPDTMEKLFTPYLSTKAAGRGLGLASLFEITRGHGGGLRVVSEPGRGTVFDVFLPATMREDSLITAATPGHDDNRPAAASGVLHAKILVADDESSVRVSLCALLESRGCAVSAVADGEAVLRHVNAHADIDLILLDVLMPRVTGIEVLTMLRAGGNRVPVILMTGHTPMGVDSLLKNLAPVEILTKPFALSELEDAIHQLLPARS